MLCLSIAEASLSQVLEFLFFVQMLAFGQHILWALFGYPYLMGRQELLSLMRLTLRQGGKQAEDLVYSFAQGHLRAFRIGEFARWCRIAREIRRQGMDD